MLTTFFAIVGFMARRVDDLIVGAVYMADCSIISTLYCPRPVDESEAYDMVFWLDDKAMKGLWKVLETHQGQSLVSAALHTEADYEHCREAMLDFFNGGGDVINFSLLEQLSELVFEDMLA